MSSSKPSPSLVADDRTALIAIARASIGHGLERGLPCDIDTIQCPQALRKDRAAFVTLELAEQLRGCIGSLEANRALALDVAVNAWSAAFRDPRFAPISAEECEELVIKISVLSEPQPLLVNDEEQLLEELRPGIDGLVLEEGDRRATFLPSVWESLQDPHVFLSQLRLKAGMPLDHWSAQMRFKRYTTETFQG